MTTALEPVSVASTEEVEFVTFHVGDILIGADIRQVESINRHVEVTAVPGAHHCVRGVINLRGDVVTVIDLRMILGLPPAEISDDTRTVIATSAGEQVGLMVDRIADVVRTRADKITPAPANVSGADGRFFKGIFKMDGELLVVLDVDAALAANAGA